MFQFVEKRKEMKSDGRTEKELEESYCFLLVDSFKVRFTKYCAVCFSPTAQKTLFALKKIPYIPTHAKFRSSLKKAL